jgi:hypothetical protein
MPYDPRMMQQIGSMGVDMLGQQRRNWWEQPLPGRPQGSQQDDPSKSNAKQQPSLLDMLMLHGGGMPSGGGAPSGSYGAIPGMGNLLSNPKFYT